MSRCAPLYSRAVPARLPRALVQVAADSLVVTHADGRWQTLALNGCAVSTGDGVYAKRFVRHMVVEGPSERLDLITPPDKGAIAPQVASVPNVRSGAAVVGDAVWQTLSDWFGRGGRLSGCTVAELARLACIATPQFAVIIGEVAASVAAAMAWERIGPMRGGNDLKTTLRPLQEAARTSPAAADALVAALAATALHRRLRRWGR